MFSTGTYVGAERAEWIYSGEKATRISEVNPKELCTIPGKEWFYGSYIPYMSRQELIQCMGAEPYWRKGKENIDYAIYKTDESHYLIVTAYTNLFLDKWYVSKVPSTNLFDKYVKIGTSIEVVRLIDSDTVDSIQKLYPNCRYFHHRVDDGTYRTIHYQKNENGEYVVSRIEHDEDEIPIFDNLLDIDYELIKNENPNEEAEFLEKLKKLNEEQNNNNVTKPIQRKPAKVKIKYAKRIKKKLIRIRFKKVKYAKKYRIKYASNKKFKKAKIITTKKTNCIIKTAGRKNYYIKVRAVNGTKKGAWSKVKKVGRR